MTTLPLLSESPALAPLYRSYFDALARRGFCGDIETAYGARLVMATDNSIYQQLCQGVVYPRHKADLILLCRLANEKRFLSLRFAPRGGGTGTNGQSLADGVIVDLSRHMNRLLEINVEQGWARVEAGMVKDALNGALLPHGLFFSPELSTSNRATIGGMINTDASGQGSLVYGKTSDHVLELDAVLIDGRELSTRPLARDALEKFCGQADWQGVLCRELKEVATTHQAEIQARFPKLNRFLTGYDLKHLYDHEQQCLDMGRILCGSEGTLAFIAEAKLNLTPIPPYRTLICIQYRDFSAALSHAPFLVSCNVLSVETMDSMVLDLARQDSVWPSVKPYLALEQDVDFMGLNMLEFASNDECEHRVKIEHLCAALDTQMTDAKLGVCGYRRCDDLAGINAIYGMRKKAVGLLGKAPGWHKPVPFVEDTAVSPEKLCDFIRDFRTILDRYQLRYGMFGHVDAGVLHVRPALDLCDRNDRQMLRQISDEVMTLTQNYQGVLWGEHGRGYRSEYGESYLGPTLYRQLRHIKGLFDPKNRLNPGKICTPLEVDAELVRVDGPMRADWDRQIPIKVRSSFSHALECNGNGLCFNFDPGALMCPSVRARGDRRHSPKGRASLLREWLRALEYRGYDPLLGEILADQDRPAQLFARMRASWQRLRGQYDFSDEVHEALEGCLACKACSSQCPVGVDVATLRSRFFNLYYSRYLRPLGDHVVANVEPLTRWMSRVPQLSNALMQPRWMQALSGRFLGMVDLPPLSAPNLPTLAQTMGSGIASLDLLASMPDEERENYLLIVQDPFTSAYEAHLVRDLLLLLQKLGYRPLLLPMYGNGKAQHVRGMLAKFKRTAARVAAQLNRAHRLEIPLLGIDPALVLCFRDEYVEVLGQGRGDFKVQLPQEWLLEHLNVIKARPDGDDCYYLFSHCTERALCPESELGWQRIFARVGVRLEPQSVSCCGMAGLYGHQRDQRDLSEQIFSQSWQPKLDKLPPHYCLATGYSCRSQSKRFSSQALKHPIQALLEILG